MKDYHQSTPDRPADTYCDGYRGASNESAATIIHKAATSCGINPQVLLVMLEKEQSLVTHTWPSQWRYDMALGQGCPDTAPCDPAFSGFFYQIYGAARQMQIYAEGRWFTWYAPGKTWNLRFHPNEACGSSPVFIENKATAALYYYTPYQPNRAALNAGYGTGDSCSAYGNRNFYNFFEDWFGSTSSRPSPTPYLLRSSSSSPIYLVAGGVRMHITTPDDLKTLEAKFGAFKVKPDAEVAAIPQQGTINRAVRDARDGVVYLLEPDGTKHRFPTPDRIVQFGYALDSIANPAPAVIDAFRTEKEVGTVARGTDTPDVFIIGPSIKHHVYDQVALTEILTTENSYVATVKPDILSPLAQKATYFGAQRLVRSVSGSAVYLTTPTSALIHVPSLDLAALYGASKGVTNVPASTIDQTAIVTTSLKPAVVCGDQGRVLDGNAFKTTTVSAAKSLGATVLTKADCAKFPAPAGSIPGSKLWPTKAGTGNIYLVDDGALRHIWSYADLLALNESSTVRTTSWNATAVAAYSAGAPFKAREGGALRFESDPRVFVMMSDKLRYVASWDALVALAGPNPSVDVRPASQRDSFEYGTSVLAGGQFARFSGNGAIYVMRDGKLRHVQTWASLLTLNSGRVPAVQELDKSLQATFTIGQPLIADGLFVRFNSGSEVYVMQNGRLCYVETYDALLRLAGGQPPMVESVSGAATDYPAGQPIR